MKIEYVEKPSSIDELIQTHRQNPKIFKTYKLNFLGVDGFDVYNICQEFEMNGKTYLPGRVEKRNSEVSKIIFFEKVNQNTYINSYVELNMMQDPCMSTIDKKLIIGGTEIYANSVGHIVSWNTSFYQGINIHDLEKFASAPAKMKDVRLVQTDKIHVFSRPQGGIAKGGRIGYTSCNSIDEINADLIDRAPLLFEHFSDECWGGVNQVHVLKSNLLGIVGHIAIMSPGDVRHYYGMVFAFNPKTRQSTKVKIICERRDFEKGAYKREDLIDVVFLGGINRNNDGTATLFTGLSDAESHCAIIEDPFLEYER